MNKSLNILVDYIEKEGYLIDKQLIKERLYSDPDEGILPITNTLDFFGVKNLVANIPKTSFDQLPDLFIAQVNRGDQYNLVLVDKTIPNKVTVVSDKKSSVVLGKEEFLSHWTGLVIAIEKNKTQIRPEKHISFVKIGLLVCLVLLTIYTGLHTQSYLKTIYFISSSFGLLLSFLIMKEKVSDAAPSRFCTISKDTSCKSVLNSNQSKLFKHIDLSDASVIYFSFITLSFIYNSNSSIFLFLSAASLPIILYSIYSQKYKIKKWCPLCLGIGLILGLQFLIQIGYYSGFSISYTTLIAPLALLTAITLGWHQLKELLLIKQQNDSLKIENLTFRRNYKLFTSYYGTLSPIDTRDGEIHDIRLGNCSDPLITILFITNPLCEMCKELHKVYRELLEKFPNEIQVKIRFLIPYNNRDELKTQISESLLALFVEERLELFNDALNEWYQHRNAPQWLKKWQQRDHFTYNKMLSKHVKWCLDNEIISTPSTLINGRLIPGSYHVKDVEMFIEPLIELEKRNLKIMHEET